MSSTFQEELEQNGFTVIEDFLTSNEIKELYEAGVKLCEQAPSEGRKVFSARNSATEQNKENYFTGSGDKVRFFFEKDALDENGELKVQPLLSLNKIGHALHSEHPTFQKITFNDRVREICWQLGYKRPAIPQSMYIYKNSGIGTEVTPHQDAAYLHTEPASVLGFWIAVQDATAENGCLQFIKGSHKSGLHRRYIRNPDPNSSELIIYDRPNPFYSESQFVKCPINKGSLILIHGNVVHRSDHNRSSASRHAYTFHVIETENTKYSEENWLQPPEGKPFPILYETKD